MPGYLSDNDSDTLLLVEGGVENNILQVDQYLKLKQRNIRKLIAGWKRYSVFKFNG